MSLTSDQQNNLIAVAEDTTLPGDTDADKLRCAVKRYICKYGTTEQCDEAKDAVQDLNCPCTGEEGGEV